MIATTSLDERFVAASGTGMEGIDQQIDFSIGLKELRRKVKELDSKYQRAFFLMYGQEDLPSERWLMRRLRISNRQVRNLKRFFKMFFS